ncbi:MAG: hypothetical protein WCT12_12535 [Verrucomicrobiota bacterium]
MTKTKEAKKFSTVPLNWKEVYYTNCPLVSASNVDQELGWTKEEFKKLGVKYAFLRSTRENDWYPHYIHNLDNLILEIGKDFMLSHGYIKKDFDVRKWAAPQFLEAAARELIQERWEKVTGDKLPTPAARIG